MRDRDAAWYNEELNSDECHCGQVKAPRYSFCPKCAAKIPVDIKKGLFRAIGRGYEDAYEQAVKYLDELS